MEVISCPSTSAAFMIVFTGTMTLNPVLFRRSTAEAFTKEQRKTQAYDLDPFTCYGISGTGPFFALADQIIREFRLRHVGYANNCSGLLLQMLTLAKRRIDAEYEAGKRRQSLDLTPVIEDMKTHFDESRDISVYAKMCSVSVSHFTHCFTKEFGVPPIKYLFNIRIEQAKYLLAETRLPVHEVASSVGFEDPLYFSRIFKKYIGIPPGQYRRMWHEKLSAQKNP